ncbi:alpha/beta-hydrolase [Daldinia vernicosa]|uniref:alpha/beta-hydrolase n=1 Tax=Daldinia vernicosa TaxID=114800 RepID=UPI002008340F|nr:alpha/beta-hydrolase [Daldinia vernicosa]KAI0852926.1 alpha/beta-hydrolase [Daldinia vernicosa]
MDYGTASKSTAAGQPPPIPRQSRHQSRRKPIDPSMHLHLRDGDIDRAGVPPASPEVISSLITSLSVISEPANKHFERQSLSMPNSPRDGSFGVEYGAFPASKLGRLQEEDIDLNDLAASPPTIRTAKPPSGFSPLTAPKSPRRESSGGGLKSLLRSSSRPSSKGSVSSHDDTRSIGNLSIERGLPPTPELRRQRSHDSWGKKQSRSHRGLMYMSSKERLRASETERKRASSGSIGTSNSLSALSPRPDTILAETPIREEPSDSPIKESMHDLSPSIDTNNVQMSIPARDSSLRKTGTNAKRSSHRSSRSRREGDGGFGDTIPEGSEHATSRDPSHTRQRHITRANSEAGARRRDDSLPPEMPHSARASTFSAKKPQETHYTHQRSRSYSTDTNGFEDGAPFPAVAQSRRRSAHGSDRKASGRTTPDLGEIIRPKRSSSRLKRLSVAGPKSPELERKKEVATPEPMVGYERPQSADSIDDAVESYLCSPRLSQKIRHPQTGRVISFSEVGDAEGSAVFCCVGMGLTRYITAFYDELALTLKLRLITPDRPGVGDSEPYADGTATPLGWPDDVYAICQALKINKFSILAHSAGAIYALATALRMPQHIRGRIHLLAPWIPPSQMNVFGTSQALPPTNAIPTSQRILRALPTPFLKAANSSFMTATSSSITSSLPKTNTRRGKRKSSAPAGRDTAGSNNRRDIAPSLDKENLVQGTADGKPLPLSASENMDRYRPNENEFNPQNTIIAAASDAIADKERQMTYDMRLTHAIWELATTGANPAVDLLVCLERRHTIGFRYVDITRPVTIHHGSRDTRVPVENVKWLGKTMRRCEVRVLEGEGHGLMASATVMGSVLMEISKEWDDWMMLTNSNKRTDERGRSIRASAR